MKVVFVCTGNTCRSIMAEGLARKWLEQNNGKAEIEIISAGIAAWPGTPASSQAVEVMQRAGIDITGHRARPLTRDLVEESTLILTMTEGHKKMVIKMFPETARKVFTLGEFADKIGKEICDPYGQPVEIYQKCALEIEELVNKALHKINLNLED